MVSFIAPPEFMRKKATNVLLAYLRNFFLVRAHTHVAEQAG